MLMLNYTQHIEAQSSINFEVEKEYPLKHQFSKIRLLPDGSILALSTRECSLFLSKNDRVFENKFGGCGLGRYQLLNPSDIDPTDGLKIFISDSENERVLVLDNKFQTLGLIRTTEDQTVNFSPGDISTNRLNELFVLIKGRNEIVKFDRYGTIDRSFGKIMISKGTNDREPIVESIQDNFLIAQDSLVKLYSGFGEYLTFFALNNQEIRDITLFGSHIYLLSDKTITILNERFKVLKTMSLTHFSEKKISLTVREKRMVLLLENRIIYLKAN